MRYQSRMDRGFMVALLSASRFLVWRCCHVDACSLRILFTGKMPAASKKAICMPEALCRRKHVEVAARAGDTPIQQALVLVRRHANLSECWHSVCSTG